MTTPLFAFQPLKRLLLNPTAWALSSAARATVVGVRAALAWSVEIAQLAREHNNANVIGLGARMHDQATAYAIVEAFISTPYSNAERHNRRIAQIATYENS
jgi:ribose 5-phosphate isomerase B